MVELNPKIIEVQPLKISIEHGTTKREIVGDFRLYGSKDDLVWLAKTILEECQEDFSVGWIEICKCKQAHLVNTPSKKWDD